MKYIKTYEVYEKPDYNFKNPVYKVGDYVIVFYRICKILEIDDQKNKYRNYLLYEFDTGNEYYVTKSEILRFATKEEIELIEMRHNIKKYNL